MTGSGSKQLNFFAMPEELDCLLGVLDNQDASIIGQPSSSPAPEILEHFPLMNEKWWADVLLCPTSLVSRIQFEFVKEQQYYLVDKFRSPIIEFMRPVPYRNELRRSRFYMHNGYWNRDDEWIAHPQEVGVLYHSLVTFVRRNLLIDEKRFGFRISRAAREFEEKGGVIRQL